MTEYNNDIYILFLFYQYIFYLYKICNLYYLYFFFFDQLNIIKLIFDNCDLPPTHHFTKLYLITHLTIFNSLNLLTP